MTIPADGWQPDLAGKPLVNRQLPKSFEAVYYEGGDGSQLIAAFDIDHVERSDERETADVHYSEDQSGQGQLRAVLTRERIYGTILLDSFYDQPSPVLAIGPEGFFFGAGDELLEFGQARDDAGEAVQGRIRTREIAPEGPQGEVLFTKATVVLEVDTGAEVTVSPIISNE